MNSAFFVALQTFGVACLVAAGSLIAAGKILEGIAVGCLGILSFVVYEVVPAKPTAVSPTQQ